VYVEKLDYLLKVETWDEFYHRRVFVISESRTSLAGG